MAKCDTFPTYLQSNGKLERLHGSLKANASVRLAWQASAK